MSNLIKVITLVLFSMLAISCEKEGPMESAGKAADEAVKEAGDAVQDAKEKMENAIENNTDK
jgi:hypothetical protein